MKVPVGRREVNGEHSGANLSKLTPELREGKGPPHKTSSLRGARVKNFHKAM